MWGRRQTLKGHKVHMTYVNSIMKYWAGFYQVQCPLLHAPFSWFMFPEQHPAHRRRPLGSAFLQTVKRTRYVYPSLQECQPQKFGKLDAETRQKHLKSLFEHGVDFPPCFFAQVVMSNIQDTLEAADRV